jgi:hypothetical protein
VFHDLTRLLECLGLIEGHLRHVDTAEESIAFFQLIHDEARSLVEFIRNDALTCSEVSPELLDTLDGITFALNHDLRRVFDGDARESLKDKTAYVVLSRVHRAHDVLTNCLQQSTVSLAIALDRTLVGAVLFKNSTKRYQQSLQLCRDLEDLLAQVETAAENPIPAESLPALKVALDKFRDESLECLMYSDWPQFESFCERIGLGGSHAEFDSVLHQFQCYIETLLGQVKMRAVLADRYVSESQGEVSELSQLSHCDSLPFENQMEQVIGREFAFAV